MTIKKMLKENNMSIYKLSKLAKIPYGTCNDIVNGKTKLEKSSAETVYKIAKALNVSMEEIIEPCLIKRNSFENFKSTICHQVKEMGDIAFIIETLESQNIRMYFEREWYPESLYLLAMIDYLSRENDIPICDEYDDLRQCKLDQTIYPSGILAIAAATKRDDALKHAAKTAIPEFKRFNIIENEVRNVI